jgi:hypothetical protein
MNSLEFGQDMPSAGNMYLRVKQKGDFVQFILGQKPSYVGKHFMEKENGWDVTSCPRINDNGEKCELCDLFFKAKAQEKKLKDAKAPQDEIDTASKEARKYSCAITFYFPVLDRTTGKFGVLQTTQGVRSKINEFHENGTDVFAKEFILRNTGKVGKDRYSLTMVDSADAKELTPEDMQEWQKAKEYDMNLINDGASQTDESLD